MMSLPDYSSYESLFGKDPEEIDRFVTEAWSTDEKRAHNFKYFNYWLGVADFAREKTFPDIYSKSPNLKWAAITIKVYRCLAIGHDIDSIMMSLMMFKSRLIIAGVVDKSLASPEEVIRWFYENLSTPFEEVMELLYIDVSKIREMGRETILNLRRIKERLSVIEVLDRHEAIEISEDLARWLAIKEQLP